MYDEKKFNVVSRMKRVLLVSSWYPSPEDPSGGVFVRNHAIAISRNFQVNVISFRFIKDPGGIWWKKELFSASANLTEEFVAIRDCGKLLNGVSLLLLSNWIVLRKLSFGKNKPDLLNLNVVYHLGVFLYPVLKLMRPVLVVTEHWTGYFPEDGRFEKLGKLTKNTIEAIFMMATRVVVISGSLRKQLQELFSVSGKTDIVSNFLNVPESARQLETFNDGKVEILTVSYMDDRMKGVSGLIDAFCAAAKDNVSVFLTIVGGGVDLDRLRMYAQSKGSLGERIRFTGPVPNDQVAGYYRKSSFFILNSNFETFSIATAEALLHGLPVIVTKCRGPEEYVDPSMGILIQKGKNDELAQAISDMITRWKSFDPDHIAAAARAKLAARPVEDQFMEVFNKVLIDK